MFRFGNYTVFLSSCSKTYPLPPPKSTLETILELKPYAEKIIGTVYSILNSDNQVFMISLKKHWKDELEVQMAEESWQDAIHRIHSSSICM